MDVHLEFNPLEHSLQTFFALHWVAIAPFFVIKIHKVSNRVKTAAYLERSSKHINQISCFEVLVLRFGPQLVSIKLVILIHKVANRKIMNMEGRKMRIIHAGYEKIVPVSNLMPFVEELEEVESVKENREKTKKP